MFDIGMVAMLVKSVLADSLADAACPGAFHALVFFTIDRLTTLAWAGCPGPAQGAVSKKIFQLTA